MRILLFSSHSYGAWDVLRLLSEGHNVEWCHVDAEPNELRVLQGLIPKPLPEPPSDPSSYDLLIFDSTGHGEEADELRQYAPLVGDGSLNSRLEDDRLYGIEVMERCGIEVPPYEVFDDVGKAIAFVEDNPTRYVFKPFTVEGEEQPSDVTYVAESAEDMVKCLPKLHERAMGAPFLLQQFIQGIECPAAGYFNGEEFFLPFLTLEAKKLMAGDLGPNTGCAGNIVLPLSYSSRLYDTTLARCVPFLAEHEFVGSIDINGIVNDGHFYGLEWTPRFGRDSDPTLWYMLESPLGDFLHAIATGQNPQHKLRAQFGTSARVTVPPYPFDGPDKYFTRGLPIKGIEPEDAARSCYLFDAMIEGEELVTAGVSGFVGAPFGCGATEDGAWEALERRVERLKVPNMQYRSDLKECLGKRLKGLKGLGWL